MIGNIRFEDGRNYICDDCKQTTKKFTSHKAALAAGWAVSRDYTKCYCPNCAPLRRHVGRAADARRKAAQLTFDNLNGA